MSTADQSPSATEQTAEDTTAAKAPFLRVVSGNPTDEDVAVLVSVFAAAGGSTDDAQPEPRDEWGHPFDRMRPPWGGAGSFTNLRY